MLDAVDDEVRRISDDCYAVARRLLRDNRARLDAIVEQLLERETLDEPEIYMAAGIPHPAPSQPAGRPRTADVRTDQGCRLGRGVTSTCSGNRGAGGGS